MTDKSKRIAAGVVAFFLFNALVARVQAWVIQIPEFGFWRSLAMDCAGTAALLAVFGLINYAIDGSR